MSAAAGAGPRSTGSPRPTYRESAFQLATTLAASALELPAPSSHRDFLAVRQFLRRSPAARGPSCLPLPLYPCPLVLFSVGTIQPISRSDFDAHFFAIAARWKLDRQLRPIK